VRKVLLQDQNNGKALELRLESEGLASYYVILAGMTINLKTGKTRGVLDSTGPAEYLWIENETYSCERYSDYRAAKQTYDTFKSRFIDC
jgi:hypothetical protein